MPTKTIGEQIVDLENTRAAKAAEMQNVAKKSMDAGETMDAEDGEKFDTLEGEVKSLDVDIARLRRLEQLNKEKAKAVDGTKASAAADSRDSRTAVQIERKLPPGVAFARFAGVMASAKGSVSDALMIAKNTFPDEPRLHSMIQNAEGIKAAVAAGTTTDSAYASPLVYAQHISAEFIEFLRPLTIIGQIPNLRRVPFNIRVGRHTNGGSAYWTGEAAPKGVTSTALDTVTLKHKKLATIAVISDELARFSTPSAELILRDTLAGAIIQQMDSDFVNPANAGTTDVKPAAITNGVTPVFSTGSTEANVRRDIQAVFAPFIGANLTPANGVWIMSSTTALALSLMVNNLGQPSFSSITMTGGSLWGMPVVVSQAVGNIVILANASDIMIADDGQVTIDTSREASLQMDTASDNPATATTVYVSLWQRNLLGIRAERYVDWVKARPAAVQYLSAVAWGS